MHVVSVWAEALVLLFGEGAVLVHETALQVSKGDHL
jgi:hypothetical protein